MYAGRDPNARSPHTRLKAIAAARGALALPSVRVGRFVPVLAVLAMAGTLFGATSASAEKPQWQATATGCLVWNSLPEPSETVTWSGACVDGKATGFGTEVFRYREKGLWKEQRYVGEMQGGKLHGRGAYTFPNGARYVGSFSNGLAKGFGTLTRFGKSVSGTWSNGCLRQGDRIAAIGVPERQCGGHDEASSAEIPPDYLIVPGEHIGALRLAGKIDDVTKLFGPGADQGPSSWPGPGFLLNHPLCRKKSSKNHRGSPLADSLTVKNEPSEREVYPCYGRANPWHGLTNPEHGFGVYSRTPSNDGESVFS